MTGSVSAHSHSRGAFEAPVQRLTAEEARRRRRVHVLLIAVLTPMVAALALGTLALWPHGGTQRVDIPGVGADTPGATYVGGQVFKVITFRCEGIGGGPGLQVQCARLRVRVQEGPDRGHAVTVLADPTVVKAGIVPGDKVRMMHYPANGAMAASYVFTDFARSSPMLLLAVVFAALVVVVARLRGLAALGGLALSFVVLLKFMVPALLSGESPLAVGVVGCGLIMFIILYLAHGVSVRTTTALIGTWFGLGAAALLGWWAVQVAHLRSRGEGKPHCLRDGRAPVDVWSAAVRHHRRQPRAASTT